MAAFTYRATGEGEYTASKGGRLVAVLLSAGGARFAVHVYKPSYPRGRGGCVAVCTDLSAAKDVVEAVFR